MSNISIFIPPELERNEIAIKRFFDAMVYKLRKNASKPSFERSDAAHCIARIKSETEEMEQAIAEGNIVETLLEGADIANFALLAATSAIDRDGKGEGGQDPKHDHIVDVVVGVRASMLVVDDIEARDGSQLQRMGEVETWVRPIQGHVPVYDPRQDPSLLSDTPRSGQPDAPGDGEPGPGAIVTAPEAPVPLPTPTEPQSEGVLLVTRPPETVETGTRVGFEAPERALPSLDATLLDGEARTPTQTLDRDSARDQGYTGDQCLNCFSMRMKIAGHCQICEDCGTSTGCS